MTKLRKPIHFETTFGTYVVDELLGEGGAGRVYGGMGIDQTPIALKVLAAERPNTDKRRRFKNEIAFLMQNKHANIVTVTDYGTADGEIVRPFYVMRKYDSNLRELMQTGISPDRVLFHFSQILDGVEAAHLLGVVHRDLKPQNILHDVVSNTLAIADFGTARFTEELLATVVETGTGQRMGNFEYAAPEQRTPGREVGIPADIYALGLMLNEMFTGVVPHGTEYRLIGQVSNGHGFLDEIVAQMLRQSPEERPISIAAVKGLIQRHQNEAVSLQRLSQINGTVIPATEIDEPLAETPPVLVEADWRGGHLTLILDRPVNQEWVNALKTMNYHSAVVGKEPASFVFHGNQAAIPARQHEVQMIIDNFKRWLPLASQNLKGILERDARRKEEANREALNRLREEEEQRLEVMRRIRI